MPLGIAPALLAIMCPFCLHTLALVYSKLRGVKPRLKRGVLSVYQAAGPSTTSFGIMAINVRTRKWWAIMAICVDPLVGILKYA